ncbi:hypothetical protein B484DRAFT_93911 [Ochromonadaceae sp. CCMP2298]|nr:hypothetical protein B484DRAFT_93911 [Ochromonadaceae sp. CCMP2298]
MEAKKRKAEDEPEAGVVEKREKLIRISTTEEDLAQASVPGYPSVSGGPGEGGGTGDIGAGSGIGIGTGTGIGTGAGTGTGIGGFGGTGIGGFGGTVGIGGMGTGGNGGTGGFLAYAKTNPFASAIANSSKKTFSFSSAGAGAGSDAGIGIGVCGVGGGVDGVGIGGAGGLGLVLGLGLGKPFGGPAPLVLPSPKSPKTNPFSSPSPAHNPFMSIVENNEDLWRSMAHDKVIVFIYAYITIYMLIYVHMCSTCGGSRRTTSSPRTRRSERVQKRLFSDPLRPKACLLGA